MTLASGVAKQVIYKEETTWNTAAGTGSAQRLRRVSSNLNLKKDTYTSAEINSHYQTVDFRHGMRRVEGTISGEVSPGTYKDFIAAAVRKAFAAVSSLTSLSITIAGSGPTYTATRGSGSFITDGIKVGDVVKFTAGSFDAANTGKNLFVLAETATVLTVMPLNGVALVAEGPIASATLAVPGKKTYVPTTGHTDKSYSIEHYFSDITQSELFTGCKVNQIGFKLPPSGMTGIDIGFIGADVTTASSAYYSSPTANTSSGILAAVNGIIAIAGTRIATLTGLDFTIKSSMTGEPVIGSNVFAGITPGDVMIDGTFTALFDSVTNRDYFVNETEIALQSAFTTSSSAAADFITAVFPRIKVGGADKDDGKKSIIQTFPFTALYNSAGGAATTTEQSTFVLQDSQA